MQDRKTKTSKYLFDITPSMFKNCIYIPLVTTIQHNPHSSRKQKNQYLPPKPMTMLPILHLILLPLIIYQTTSFASAVDPTQGFTQLPLDNSNFQIQKPYDVSVNQRYTFTNGVHKFWIYPTDKPFMSGSNTQPRTEIRITVSKNSISQNMFLLLLLLLFCLYIPSYIHHFTLYFYFQGYDYTSGIWQFEGYGYVPSGTSGVCIMQVFGGSSTATTSQLRVYDGSLTYYRSPVLSANIYNRWFRVNAIHDVGANNVKIYIDGGLKYNGDGRGAGTHYFKIGVYVQNDPSGYMESRWRDMKVFKKQCVFVFGFNQY